VTGLRRGSGRADRPIPCALCAAPVPNGNLTRTDV